ncbi:MAG: gamma-glutamyltransferase [Gemmatimonadota bacterium]
MSSAARSLASRRRGPVLLLVTGLATLAACSGGEPASTPWAFPTGWMYSASVEPVTADSGMVVSTDSIASTVGIAILKAGGNAVDAAVATGFALAVVNPEAGNIGGGGFMVVRLADGESYALDYREKAPAAATRDMYLDEHGNLTDKSVVGHLAAGVPGSVSGLWAAHQRFGVLPWADVVQPAIDLADGFPLHARLAGGLTFSREALARFPSTAAQFLPGGEAPALGARFAQPDLARTLTRIRDEGPDGFYRGETADLIVAEMRRGGGIITHADLEAYTPAWRDPIRFTYRNHTLLSMPPSSSGGATMAEIANMVEAFDLRSMRWHSPDQLHVYVEAARRAFSDRNEYLADPDFVSMPLDRMVSKAYARERGADIQRSQATPSSEVGPGLGPSERGGETTHYSVVDAQGNAVATTTTLNSWYGNGVTVTGAGFLLNNEMDDFAAKPGTPNQFGLVQGENNAIEPGKRMLSAMTPTIVLDAQGDLFLVTGTPGGSTIITTVFQMISNVIDYGMNVAQAVNAPRVHHQHLPDVVVYEFGALDDATVAGLETLGHRLQEREQGETDAYFSGGVSGDVQAIQVGADGRLQGWSDPRRGGKAVGW